MSNEEEDSPSSIISNISFFESGEVISPEEISSEDEIIDFEEASEAKESESSEEQATQQPAEPRENSSESSSVSTVIMSTPKKVTIGGFDLTSETHAQDTKDLSAQATFSMGKRLKMKPEELDAIYKQAAYYDKNANVPRFRVLDEKTEEDSYQLKESGRIDTLILAMVRRLQNYDMLSVFENVMIFPDKDTQFDLNKANQHNLIDSYMSMTAAQVAKSNEWYHLYLSSSEQGVQGLFQDNLRVTENYLTNHCTPKLHAKVLTLYNNYPRQQQGGPLYFKLMMNVLQQDSASHVNKLNLQVKNELKITGFDGEDVTAVVSIIRSAYSVMTNFKDKNGKSNIPPDFATNVLGALQTSSTPAFNDYVKSLGTVHWDALYKDPNAELDIPATLDKCVAYYQHLVGLDQWVIPADKSRTASFLAGGSAGTPGAVTCFNCGENHPCKECPKPHDQARIERNLAKYKKDKAAAKKKAQDEKNRGSGGGGGGKNGKWREPTAEEKANQSRRTIDGKLMFYHYNTKRWRPVPAARLAQDAARASASAPAASPATAPAASPAPAPAAAAPASAPAGGGFTAQQLNQFRSLQTMMNGLMENLS